MGICCLKSESVFEHETFPFRVQCRHHSAMLHCEAIFEKVSSPGSCHHLKGWSAMDLSYAYLCCKCKLVEWLEHVFVK